MSVTRKHVDLPMNIEVFRSLFSRYFTGFSTKQIISKKIRTQVSSQQLEEVFGADWHVVTFPNSSTQIKVIGNIVLLYRQKCPKYLKTNR